VRGEGSSTNGKGAKGKVKGKEMGRKTATMIEIQPWESLKAFNRYVAHFPPPKKKWRLDFSSHLITLFFPPSFEPLGESRITCVR
jgi:hypothetical protein